MNDLYSITQVRKAGEDLLNLDISKDEKRFDEIFDILSYWRLSHEWTLTQVFIRLKKVALEHDRNPILAKRLKRYKSIFSKLLRFRKMKLNTIQDIWWCRVVVNTPKKVIKIIRDLKKWPEFKNDDWSINIDDYIINPKDDWYRSVHLKWKFKDEYWWFKKIEIQVRTTLQHDRATALEIVDIFTKQNLKSNQWEKDWQDFFINVSRQFAAMEQTHLFNFTSQKSRDDYYFLVNSDTDLLDSHKLTKGLIRKLKIIDKFNAYAQSVDIVNWKIDETKIKWYVMIEINLEENKVMSTFFSESQSTDAEKIYSEKEKKIAEGEIGNIIALVYTSALSDIKEAYPNYFADSTEFLNYVNVIAKSPF